MTALSIVHTEASLGWGGQELRILAESQGLMRRGHDVRLLYPPESCIFAEAALVVPPRDGVALRAAVSRLLDDGVLRTQLGEAARAHCAASFSYERMLDRMEAIYEQVSRRR
jgi:hypothetical protein